MTENKRRYRARRKEYVSDLERRLAEAREQGVDATMEVQLAARKVVEENERLRELLRLAGFAVEEIDVWARRGHRSANANGAVSPRRREIEHKAGQCMAFTADHKRPAMEGEKTCSPSKSNRKREMDRDRNMSESISTPTSTQGSLVSELNTSNCPDTNTTTATGLVVVTSEPPTAAKIETSTCHGKTIMPCQLVSRLAENPAADITQIPVRPSSADPLKDAQHYGGDVECGKAYEMLMHYATSEEKMEHVARALEGGCTSTGKGNCVVKKNVVWEALDSMCG